MSSVLVTELPVPPQSLRRATAGHIRDLPYDQRTRSPKVNHEVRQQVHQQKRDHHELEPQIHLARVLRALGGFPIGGNVAATWQESTNAADQDPERF